MEQFQLKGVFSSEYGFHGQEFVYYQRRGFCLEALKLTGKFIQLENSVYF